MLSDSQVRQKQLNAQALHYAWLLFLLGGAIAVFGFLGEASLPVALVGLGAIVHGAFGYWLCRKTKRLEQSVKIDTPDWERAAIEQSVARWQLWLNRWGMLTISAFLILFIWYTIDNISSGDHISIKRWIAIVCGDVGFAWMFYLRLKHAFQTHIF